MLSRKERKQEEKQQKELLMYRHRRHMLSKKESNNDKKYDTKTKKSNSHINLSHANSSSSNNNVNNIKNASSPVSETRVKKILSHPFKADFNDHFETSLAALRDVKPAIEELRQLTRPSTPECFTLYDPYYCNGTVVQHWRSLGFTRVLHDNRDFYVDIDQHTVPGPFDMLVTNPPFGEDHLKRLLSYLITIDTPWAFLAPDYVATKAWYKELVATHFTHVDANNVVGNRFSSYQALKPRVTPELPPFLRYKERLEEQTSVQKLSEVELTIVNSERADKIGLEPFYIVPRVRYDYEHPIGAGHAHSHFKSMWYVFTRRHMKEVIRATQIALLHQNGTEQSSPTVIHGLGALQEHMHRLLKRLRSHKK